MNATGINKSSKNIKRCLMEWGRDMLDERGYFRDYRQNIFPAEMENRFKEAFEKGAGKELELKACAPHSSSMLSFNFFHWIRKGASLAIDAVNYDEVLFEEKLPVLKGRMPAHMDVVLKNGAGDYLFIESKFLEYEYSSACLEIRESYMDKDNYYCGGEQWAKFIREYKDCSVRMNKRQYWSGIKQEICHMIGLTKWFSENPKPHSARFFNLVFEPAARYEKSHEKFVAYKECYEKLCDALCEAQLIPDSLQIAFKTYGDIWPAVKGSNLPDGLGKYLCERYMRFAKEWI